MAPPRRPPTGTESTVNDVAMAYNGMGNWSSYTSAPSTTGGTGSSASETRGVNFSNQINSVTGMVLPQYDSDGNMTTLPTRACRTPPLSGPSTTPGAGWSKWTTRAATRSRCTSTMARGG